MLPAYQIANTKSGLNVCSLLKFYSFQITILYFPSLYILRSLKYSEKQICFSSVIFVWLHSSLWVWDKVVKAFSKCAFTCVSFQWLSPSVLLFSHLFPGILCRSRLSFYMPQLDSLWILNIVRQYMRYFLMASSLLLRDFIIWKPRSLLTLLLFRYYFWPYRRLIFWYII